jgi:hypothetical protein
VAAASPTSLIILPAYPGDVAMEVPTHTRRPFSRSLK